MTADTSRPAVEALIADLRKDAKRDAAHRNEHARATRFNRKTMPSWVSADVLAALLDERDAARDSSVWRDTIDEQRAYIRDLEATHKQDMHAIGQHALAQSVVLDKLREAEAERDKLAAELDAYKRAKAENDERFQIEASKHRERAERAEAKLDAVKAAVERCTEDRLGERMQSTPVVAKATIRTILANTDEGSSK